MIRKSQSYRSSCAKDVNIGALYFRSNLLRELPERSAVSKCFNTWHNLVIARRHVSVVASQFCYSIDIFPPARSLFPLPFPPSTLHRRLFHSVYLGLFKQHRATNRESDGVDPSEWSTRMYSVQEEVTRLTSLKARGIFSAMPRSRMLRATDSRTARTVAFPEMHAYANTMNTSASHDEKLSLGRNRLDSVTLAACAQRNARFTRAARIPFTHEGKLRKVNSSSRYVNKIRLATIWYSFFAHICSVCVRACVCTCTDIIYIYIRYRFLCH